MNTRKIEVVVPPREPHYVGDGFRVHNFIPGAYRMDMVRMDPFIMLDYNSKYYFPPAEKPRGVGVHPHRGFETVTIAYKGSVAHHDSSGGGGVIKEGDVQWMTAASGILHKEFHEEEFSRQGGDFQMIQLWVNLPAKDKMDKPHYQAIAAGAMGRVPLPGDQGEVEIIAGEYQGIKGPANTYTPVHLMNARIKPGGKAVFNFPAEYATGLLVVEGNIRVNDTEDVPTDHFVLFEKVAGDITLEASDQAVVMVMSGAPIGEPIAAHGPFVMNTRQELVDAFNDFNLGKFGYLED